MIVGSLALHVVALAALIFWVRSQPPVNLPAPGPPSFELQFDAGAKTASSPNPAPDVKPAPTAGEPQPSNSQMASIAEPDAAAQPPPAPEIGPPQPETPPEPPRVSVTLPEPTPSPAPVPDIMPQPPPPLPAPRPRPRVFARPTGPQNPFAGARDYSLNAPSHPTQQGALGTATASGTTRNEFATVHGANVGRDWMGELARWVHERWIYPEQAIVNNEDGTTIADLEVDKYGKVLSIRIATRSGSPWLDMGVQSLFRGRTLPPFPPGTVDEPIRITLNMNYVLYRR